MTIARELASEAGAIGEDTTGGSTVRSVILVSEIGCLIRLAMGVSSSSDS